MFTGANGDRSDSPNMLFIITNGNSNNRERTINEARATRRDGVHIFVAIIGNWYQEQEINAMASYPYQQNVMKLPRWSNLDQGFKDKMRSLICNSEYWDIFP